MAAMLARQGKYNSTKIKKEIKENGIYEAMKQLNLLSLS